MACRNCSSGGGIPKGCKNNGTCSSGGCNKLEVFDWLSNMELPADQKPFLCVEVRFKNGRKEFYRNTNDLPLHIGDTVAVESSPGHDIGIVTLTGELVRMQMRKKKERTPEDELPVVYRKATERDVEVWREAQEREVGSMYKSRELAQRLGLKMKISDVEYQGDNGKATFYYTADDRVDFRQLIKDLAGEFRVRIEMRQIGARQESARLGGIGSCGRELCCSTWLTDFRSVNTSAARYQQLSLNPQKLAGQCGKLKCCLNYELDTYLDALRDFPDTNRVLKTEKGEAFFQKMDIFKRLMWYSYRERPDRFIELPVEEVNTIIRENENGKLPDCLEDFCVEKEVEVEVGFENSEGEGDLNRFDKKKSNKRRNSRNKKRNFKNKRSQPNSKENKSNSPQKKNNPSDNGPKNQGGKRRKPGRGKGKRPNSNSKSNGSDNKTS
jgi:cell fate regulator YaaT (PSP1 superfamily)